MMKASLSQLKSLYEASSWPQRVAFIGTSLAGLTLLLFLATPNSEEEYRTLCGDIDDKTSVVAIADDLEKAGIFYRIGNGGHSIEVREKDLSRALGLVVQTTPRAPGKQSSMANIFAGPIISSPRNRQGAEIRRREDELAHTISLYGSVRRTRVLITPADNRIFSRKRKEARAAVFLQLVPGKRLTRGKVQAIRDLVANSVQGLRKENITIADSSGTDYEDLLEREESERAKAELELQEKVEALLAQKIVAHLSAMFGKDNVSVAVSAHVDLSTKKKTYVGYVGRSKKGVQMVSLSTASRRPYSRSRKRSRKGRRKRSIFDSVTSLCVAIFVDSKLFAKGGIPDNLKDAVLANIKTVARLNEERGDKISVQAVPFQRATSQSKVKPPVCNVPLSTSARTDRLTLTSSVSSWTVGGPTLLALLTLLYLVVRRRQAMTKKMEADATAMSGVFNVNVHSVTNCSLDDWHSTTVNDDLVRGTAEQDPEVVARLIRTIRLDENEDIEY